MTLPQCLGLWTTSPSLLGGDHLPRPRNGFLKLLQEALRVRPDGLAAFGVPCGSYIFLNSPTHQRNPTNPFGNEERGYVCTANMWGPKLGTWTHLFYSCIPETKSCFLGVAKCAFLFPNLVVMNFATCRSNLLRIGCRCALIMLVLICRAVYIFVEQPASSRLFVVPYFTFIQEVCQRFSIPSHNYFLPESQVSEKKKVFEN